MTIVFSWWMLDDGGYFPASWLPGTALALCLVAVAVFAGAARRPRRAAVLALAAMALYTAWSFASTSWADAPGPAMEGSQRTLLYLACFGLFALLRWTPRAAMWMLGAFVAIATAAGLLTLLRAAGAEDPAQLFVEHRLAAPLGYQNASAALWTMAAMPAMVLAASRHVGMFLRPLLLGSAPLLLGLAVLAQSRGWLFTLPLVLLLTLAVSPARARLVVLALLPVAGALAVAGGDLLEPYRVGGQLPPAETAHLVRPAIDAAVRSLLLVSGVLVLAGAAFVWVERFVTARREPSTRPRRVSPRLAVAAAAALLASGTILGVALTDGHPVERVEGAWTEFKEVDLSSDDGSRFTSVGGQRYDFWRVAIDQWADHPLGGLGQDNYALAYVRERGTAAEPRWVHSLPLRLLAHTGLVGALLFLTFVIATLVAATRPWLRERTSGAARLAGAVALLPATVWLVHGSVDWLWEYPALTGPALAFAGIAVALGDRARAEADPPLAFAVSRRAAVAAAGFALVGLAIVVPTYIAARDVREASRRWPEDPAIALARLDRAATLNPLDVQAPLVEASIAVSTGDLGRAQRALADAAEREPGNWFVRFAQGLVASARDTPRAAAQHLRAAQGLNPREGLIDEALRRAGRARPMRLDEALARLARRVERLRA